MLTVKVNKNPWDDKRNLYTYKELTLDYGITVLVGCNGCGKSTLLKFIERTLENNDILYRFHDSRKECSSGMDKMLFYSQTQSLANYVMSSEGERIDQLLGDVVGYMGHLIHIKHTTDDLAFLFDGIDSGLSIDSIAEIKDVFHDIVLKEHPNTYIIFSANSYELARDETCIYARTGKKETFVNYEDYKKFVLKSKEEKTKRYKA